MRVHDVPQTFGHLAAISASNETVHHHAFRQWNSCAHEHRWPDNRVKPMDILADDVHVGRPESAQRLLGIDPVNAAEVVDEGIEPHIHDVSLAVNQVFWTADAPVEGSTADGEVAELDGFQPLQDLSSVLSWLNELRLLLDQLDHLLLVLREAEEEAGLRHLLQGCSGGGVLEIELLCLLVRDEPLLPDHVPTLVAVEVDVPLLLANIPD
mmetsp:Transcript_128147/g.304237  ORF Transcript_128147/g.304237 Transcript_128147/m.304237 type:complete len:210 (+) Transcript_128147:774-1403(+)